LVPRAARTHTRQVNVLEPHPSSSAMATSGLDDDVKVWLPTAIIDEHGDDEEDVGVARCAVSPHFVNAAREFQQETVRHSRAQEGDAR